jgi:hypothetical protein
MALPALRAKDEADAAAARLAVMQPQRTAAATAQRELARATTALAEVGRFGQRRASPTRLLADLSRALPPGAAVVVFHADTAGGSVVAVAPRAAAILTALQKMEGVSSPEITGPVTREMMGGVEVERVSVRFRLDPLRRARGDEGALR